MGRSRRGAGVGVVAVVVAAVVAALPARVWPADWSQFRGPGGLGMTGQALPERWGKDDNLLWKLELPGPGTSSPVVHGDRIYLTCFTGYNVPGRPGGSMDQLKRHLLCIDRAEGKVLWTKEVPSQLPDRDSIRENHGYASSTPAVDAEHVYVFFGKSGVFAFTHEGKQVWQADVGDGLSGWGSANSPVLFGDLVLINASVESQSLVALDRRTGKDVWRTKGVNQSWNTPLLVDAGGRTEVVLATMGNVLGFDPQSGAQLWSCKTDIPWYMVPSLVAHDGVVYCVGGRDPGGALAVRAGGKGDVTQNRLWKLNNGSNVPSPIFHEGRLYWINEKLNVAYCVEGNTGKILYEQRVPGVAQVYASPVLAAGKIYYVSRDGRAAVVAVGPEFKVLATNDLRDGSMFNASPAVDGNRLLLRSDKFLYCIGAK